MTTTIYNPRDLLPRKNYKVEVSQTNYPLSKPVTLHKQDSTEIAVFFTISNFGGGEAIAKIQENSGNGEWTDVGEVTEVCLTQDGTYGIKLSQGVQIEALVLPLSNPVRIVVTTDATSSFTLDDLYVTKNAG